MKAVAVRERGTEKRRKLILFIYRAPPCIKNQIESWIGVQRSNANDKTLMSSTKDDPSESGFLLKMNCE